MPFFYENKGHFSERVFIKKLGFGCVLLDRLDLGVGKKKESDTFMYPILFFSGLVYYSPV